jgi:hypothetical protein
MVIHTGFLSWHLSGKQNGTQFMRCKSEKRKEI